MTVASTIAWTLSVRSRSDIGTTVVAAVRVAPTATTAHSATSKAHLRPAISISPIRGVNSGLDGILYLPGARAHAEERPETPAVGVGRDLDANQIGDRRRE